MNFTIKYLYKIQILINLQKKIARITPFIQIFNLFCYVVFFAQCFVFLCLHTKKNQLASSDGRLYRCNASRSLSNGALATTDDAASEEDWETLEASRTHSVKFSDPQEQDNREVSSTNSTTTWGWLIDCYEHTIQIYYRIESFICGGGTLRRNESYYTLNTLEKIDDR